MAVFGFVGHVHDFRVDDHVQLLIVVGNDDTKGYADLRSG